jgi:putative iron-regulated protein
VIAAKDAALDTEIKGLLADTLSKMHVMADRAEAGEAYDQQIGEGNVEGNAVVQAAIDGLIAQTRGIERAVALLQLDNVTIEDSDSLSNPDAVFE